MPWGLTSETFWRREGEDIVLANPRSILRLNAASAQIFLALLDIADPQVDLATRTTEKALLIRLLSNEKMLVLTGDAPPDPWRQQLAHLLVYRNHT